MYLTSSCSPALVQLFQASVQEIKTEDGDDDDDDDDDDENDEEGF